MRRSAATSREAVLVIRVWTEPSVAGIRARLVWGDRDDPGSTRAVAGPEEVVDAVRTWLDEFAR